VITEQALREAIAECQGERSPNRDTCIMLAAFYTIQEHLYPTEAPQYSFAAPPEQVSYDSGTEFSQVISGLPTERVYAVMDEAMTTLEAIMPRLYNGIMRQLTE
jgi:hypothetical protein